MSDAPIVRSEQQEFYLWLNQPERLQALSKASAQGLDAGYLARAILQALARAPRLWDRRCWPSVWRSVCDCLQQGLLPNGVDAAIVPFVEKGQEYPTATLLVMYQGLVKLAANENVIVTAAQHVFANEGFRHRPGQQPPFDHQPLPPSQRGEYVGTYATAAINGLLIGEWMFGEEIAGIRDRSRAKDEGPWQTDAGEMAKKTVIRRLLKKLPKSARFSAVLATDDETEYGLPTALTPAIEPTSNPSALAGPPPAKRGRPRKQEPGDFVSQTQQKPQTESTAESATLGNA